MAWYWWLFSCVALGLLAFLIYEGGQRFSSAKWSISETIFMIGFWPIMLAIVILTVFIFFLHDAIEYLISGIFRKR